jgi:hypothetical protein
MDLASYREYRSFNYMKFSLHAKVVDGCVKPGIGAE